MFFHRCSHFHFFLSHAQFYINQYLVKKLQKVFHMKMKSQYKNNLQRGRMETSMMISSSILILIAANWVTFYLNKSIAKALVYCRPALVYCPVDFEDITWVFRKCVAFWKQRGRHLLLALSLATCLFFLTALSVGHNLYNLFFFNFAPQTP